MVGLLTVSLGLGLYQCDMHRDSDAYWRPTLQKQVGCFNHRVVTTVADKLKRPWL